MKIKKDLISVVMPVYNHKKFIAGAIEDILKQTHSNFELILVDDGSTDGTTEIMKEYANKDKRVKYLRKDNGGTGSALNLGFANAFGDYGTWVSSDDVKYPDFLETLLKALKESDSGLVFSSFFEIANNRKYLVNLVGLPPNKDGFVEVKDFVERTHKYCITGICYLFTMKLKTLCGEYILLPGEDYYMGAQMGLQSRVTFVPRPLGEHRAHPDSLTVKNPQCVLRANDLTRTLIEEKLKLRKRWFLTKIPKIANFYWSGGAMSYLRYMTIKSFMLFNPAWEIRLYVNDGLLSDVKKNWRTTESIGDVYKGADYLNVLRETPGVRVFKVDFTGSEWHNRAPAIKSDVVGWNVLANVGGLWSDLDILYFRPMEDIDINVQENSDVDTGVCYIKYDTGYLEHRIGFLLSGGGRNRLFSKIGQITQKLDSMNNYQSVGSLALNDNYLKCLEEDKEINSVNLSMSDVYPCNWNETKDLFEEDKFADYLSIKNCVGIHWYGGDLNMQKINNSLKVAQDIKLLKKNTVRSALEYILDLAGRK